jgi:hypothetical protein
MIHARCLCGQMHLLVQVVVPCIVPCSLTDFVQVEAVRVAAGHALEKGVAVLGGAERGLDLLACKYVQHREAQEYWHQHTVWALQNAKHRAQGAPSNKGHQLAWIAAKRHSSCSPSHRMPSMVWMQRAASSSRMYVT